VNSKTVDTDGHRERSNDVRIASVPLEAFARSIFEKAGLRSEDASTAASVLTRTSARGIATHGIGLLPLYVQRLQTGSVNASAVVRPIVETPATVLLDGDGGLGQVVSSRAVETLIPRASSVGIAAVGVRNSSHLGAAGHYALVGAEAGLFTMVWSGSSPVMHAPGAIGRTLTNGPTAYASPTEDAPIVFDACMSIVSGSQIRSASARHTSVPNEWLQDSFGQPTSDPDDFAVGGSLSPMGAHKGMGLALLAELLAGTMTGASQGLAAPAFDGPLPQRFDVGHFMLAFDPAAFGDASAFRGRVAAFADEVRAAPVVDGAAAIRMPGDAAAAREEEARTLGVLVAASNWETLCHLGRDVGVDPPQPM
jgi:LDH2 family malate/lactate/ureidoglycolate dehydrogenase